MSKIYFSVVIPTKNRENSIGTMLTTLVKQTFKSFEVLVVDGGSTDRTLDIVKKFQKKITIRIIHKTGGLIAQMNEAIKYAKGEVFVRTDDDVVVTSKWLQSIKETFELDKKVGGVTGPTVIPKKYSKSRDLFFFQNRLKKGGLFWRIIGSFYYNYLLEGQEKRVCHWFKSGAFSLGSNFSSARQKPIQEIDNLEACNWSVKTRLLKKIGGFDSVYSGIGEYHEPDASLKIKELGYKLMFHPKAEVNHCPSIEGFFNERPLSYPRIINFIIFYKRHIKIDSVDKLLRFSAYLIFQNLYYTYQAFTKKQPKLLGSYLGTIVGLFSNASYETKTI